MTVPERRGPSTCKQVVEKGGSSNQSCSIQVSEFDYDKCLMQAGAISTMLPNSEKKHTKHQELLFVRRAYHEVDNSDGAILATAHDLGRPVPKLIMYTLLSGDIVGQRTKWHRVVCEVGKRVLDYTIKDYKKATKAWKCGIDLIEYEVNKMFYFSPVPVKRDVLERYV